MSRLWKNLLVFGWLGSILWMAACNPRQESRAMIVTPSPLLFTSTPTLWVVQSSTPNGQVSPGISATPSAIPTSTPWPTVDPTLYSTLYVTSTQPSVPTPNYFAQMKEIYRLMIGEWWGKMWVTVNQQGRKVQYAIRVLQPVRNRANLWALSF